MSKLLQKETALLQNWKAIKQCGRVSSVKGSLVHSTGIRGFVGEHCRIINTFSEEVHSQIIGFSKEETLLMPFSDNHYIHPGAEVIPSHTPIPRPDFRYLLGRIIDPFGNPLDNREPVPKKARYSVKNRSKDIIRKPIQEIFPTGISLIDAFLTLGKGQRIAIFSEPGQGKTSLLSSITKNSEADIYVTALIGERSREVGEYVNFLSSSSKRSQTVSVVASSAEAAMTKVLAAHVAVEIAEYFCCQGLHVVFIMDSLSRYGMALQEIGLALGEHPSQHCYPASVFYQTAKLVERAGNTSEGSITALYSVLCYQNIPDVFVDYTKSLMDGHFVLTPYENSLTMFPRIDLLKSLSRSASSLISTTHLHKTRVILDLLKTYQENIDVIQLGGYTPGTHQELDQALLMLPALKKFIDQNGQQSRDYTTTIQNLMDLCW